MGQTLTHGIYLPDEGERNCYDGLAGNWQLLDGAVGTIAEHTAALAGKAPLVHTHTKSDITDFPAYGNAAGTICEGNDSRLSDARTPVAHTHTKSDVTDLFNSANTWSEAQTFLTNQFMKHNSLEKGVAPSTISSRYISFTDKNNAQVSSLMARTNPDGESYIALRAENLYKNGAMDPTGDTVYSMFYVGMTKEGVPYCVPRAHLYPDRNSVYDLGTSTNKWKSLNGINPGALSLPSTVAESFNGDITDKTGNASNNKTWSINGWGYIYIDNVAGNFISVVTNSVKEIYLTTGTGTGNGNISVSFPIVSGRTYSIFVKTSGSVSAYYMPTLGNV